MSSTSYNSNGTVNVATDVNGTTSTYSYSGVCDSLMPTGVTISGTNVSLSRSMAWDCNGGVQTSLTDENHNVTTTNFTSGSTADPYYRPLSVVDPIPNTTSFSYSPTTFESTMNFNGSVSTTDTLATTDGLGRPIFKQNKQGQSSSTFDSAQTSYGWTTTTTTVAGGPFTTQSVAYAGTAGQTAPTGTGVTTTQYDAMGRPLTVTDAGGGTVSYAYTANTMYDVLQKVGPTQNFQKQLEYDGLGRLVSVCEITSASGSGSCGQSNPATGFLTKYSYDALGNLLTVTQNAQTRTYQYDGLSRLTYEKNPESGAATYTYDAVFGCAGSQPGDLTAITKPDGSWICYIHDGLHRLTDVGNSSQSGTNYCKRFRYDSSQGYFGSIPTGVSVSNSLGRMVEAATDNCGITQDSMLTDEWFSYDKDGNVGDTWESTPHSGLYYHSVATFAGNSTPLTVRLANPSLYTMTYGLDGEGRASSLKEGTATIVAGTTFNTSSQPTYIDLGTGTDQSDYIYDLTGRMKNWTFQVGSDSETAALTWNPNGTLQQLAIVDGFNSAGSQTCTFGTASGNGYDDLGRLISASCGSVWGQTFSYDQYGNLTKSGSSSWDPGYNPASNHYTSGTTYDNNGNLTNDSIHAYTWDVYGKLSSIDSSACATNGECVTYDALGRTVETSYNGAYTEIWYTQLGKTAYMTGGSTPYYAYWPTPGNGTVEVNGNAASNYYMHKDWLGNSRISSGISNHTILSDQAYAPFGEVYNKLATGASTPGQMFTGDTEDIIAGIFDTPNRELNVGQGRWISPDPAGLNAADPSNPQSWNRYAYVLNNPLSYKDPLGLYCDYSDHDDPSSGFDSSQFDYNSNTGECTDNGGQWVDDAYTQNGADLAGRPQHAVASNTTGQQGTLWQYLTTTVPIYVPNDVPLSPSAQRYITAIANAAPTLCGGGVYYYAGRELSAGAVHGFAGAINEFDTVNGTSGGALFEAGGGTVAGIQGGGGYVVSTDGNATLGSEGLAYGGFGVDTPVVSASAGTVGFTSGAGLYAEGFLFGRGGGFGVYLNVTTNGGCAKHK